LPLGVRVLLGTDLRSPVGDQLVSHAHAGRDMGEHAPRPLGRCSTTLDNRFIGFGGVSHIVRITAEAGAFDSMFVPRLRVAFAALFPRLLQGKDI
jgi:hypothetical protein